MTVKIKVRQAKRQNERVVLKPVLPGVVPSSINAYIEVVPIEISREYFFEFSQVNLVDVTTREEVLNFTLPSVGLFFDDESTLEISHPYKLTLSEEGETFFEITSAINQLLIHSVQDLLPQKDIEVLILTEDYSIITYKKI